MEILDRVLFVIRLLALRGWQTLCVRQERHLGAWTHID